MKRCCDTCKWFDGAEKHGFGYCHFSLEPHPGTYNDFDIDNLFDKRDPDEGCDCQHWQPDDIPSA